MNVFPARSTPAISTWALVKSRVSVRRSYLAPTMGASLFSGKTPPSLGSTRHQRFWVNPEAQTRHLPGPVLWGGCCAEENNPTCVERACGAPRQTAGKWAEEGSAALTGVTASATRVGFGRAILRELSRSNRAGKILRVQVFYLEAFEYQRCIPFGESRPTSPPTTGPVRPS